MASDAVSSGNKHIICQYKDSIASFGLFLHRNPLEYSVPLLLLQLSLITITSTIIELCLHPLGQSSVVAQILGGVLYGPSLLGHDPKIGNTLFPGRSVIILETAAAFGIMFFFFAIGVGSDTKLMFHPPKQSVIIGISAMFTTIFLTVLFSFALKSYVHMDDSLARALPFIAASQGLTGFPNIAYFLSELKMSNSDLGRLAISSAMLCDLFGMSLIGVLLAIIQSQGNPLKSALSISSAFIFVLCMAYLVGPLVRRVSRSVPNAKSMTEIHVFFFFAGALVTAFMTEVIGQHFVLGPLVLGLLVPEGQPLGAALISKLEFPIGKFLYPTFLTTSGLKTDVFKIDLWSLWIVTVLMVFATLIKIVAVVCSGHFLKINFREGVVIGLMLNARGVCELIVFNLWREAGILTDQEFALSVLSVIAVTSVITPLIKLLYDPTKQNVPLKRRTIQHLKRDAELRILVCIRNQDNIPIIVNLLEASNATEQSPIAVIAVLLVELVGRATQMVVAHQSTRSLQPVHSDSGPIVNALRQYELCNERCVTVQLFSAISLMHAMHDDIFRVALDQNATILILPFHKHWEIDGSIGSENRAIQNMNVKVLDRAPCSVGILVDRAILTGSLSILNNQSAFRVGVVFIGGPDDGESLCYGARMGRHVNVTLTIIRFLLFGCDTARERKHDNNLIDEVRQANMGNQNFIYQEQVVKDGVGLAGSLRGLGNSFDLMIVGRHHQGSEILTGLGAWSECPELGVVGDMLASQDFQGTASVLVVQQQRLPGEKLKDRMMRPVVISHESLHDPPVSDLAGPAAGGDYNPRWEIAIDRDRA
ncbi:cation/H(+) antiporter 15 [Phtheirospermum japonicum]|uniref:Cation/H(+) antiporter 15 n=1 Tax=Phtheirospermum japonicum TaxID=374723 RepID=A0A830BR54_9LAMI|nr:cation/H(+) antiporter 15 [Phtheirospermum japonicum]